MCISSRTRKTLVLFELVLGCKLYRIERTRNLDRRLSNTMDTMEGVISNGIRRMCFGVISGSLESLRQLVLKGSVW
jgi:hypothetical protein